jgi:hypothetical protein
LNFIDFSIILIFLSASLDLMLNWKKYSKELWMGNDVEKHYIYLTSIVFYLLVTLYWRFFDKQFLAPAGVILLSLGLFFTEFSNTPGLVKRNKSIIPPSFLQRLLFPSLNLLYGLLFALTVLWFWFFKNAMYPNLLFLIHIVSRGMLWLWKLMFFLNYHS